MSLLIFSIFQILTFRFIVIFSNNAEAWPVTFRLAGGCVVAWGVTGKDFLGNPSRNEL